MGHLSRRRLLKTCGLGLASGALAGQLEINQPSNTFTIETFDGGPLVEYEFAVAGEVDKGPAADNSDTVTETNGTTRVSGNVGNGFSDEYRVAAEPFRFSANVDSSHYRLFFNGREIPPPNEPSDGGQPDNTFTIETFDGGPLVEYEFTVAGEVVKGPAADNSDTITETNGITRVSGNVGNGFSDEYRVAERPFDFSANVDSSNYRLLFNGRVIPPNGNGNGKPPNTFEIETFEDGPLVEYEFTVAGDVVKGPAADDSDTITETNGITRVSGNVGNGFSDEYNVEARPYDFSFNVDSSHYRLLYNGRVISPNGNGGAKPPNTFTIETFENGPLVEYEFTVVGDVVKGPAANNSDTVTETNGRTRVSGNVGNGFSDEYRVAERPFDFTANVDSSHYRLLFNGREIPPPNGPGDRDQPDHTFTIETFDGGPLVEYEFTVVGDVVKGPAADDSDTVTETNLPPTRVSGNVGNGFSDEYKVDGEPFNFTANVDSSHYRLYYNDRQIDNSDVV